MTRYFFDVLNNGNVASDDEGMILPSMDAARREAYRTLGDLAHDTLRSIGAPTSPRVGIEVRTSDGPIFEAAILWNLWPSR